MNRVVDLAELIKRRIKGLYSDTEMESQVDKFDESRTILSLKVTLSKKKLNEKSPGFQVPIDESLVTPYVEEPEHAEHKEDQVYEKHEDDGEHRGRGYGRGYRGFRGSRGGYGRPYRGTRGTRGSRGSEFYSSRGDQGHRGGYGYNDKNDYY